MKKETIKSILSKLLYDRREHPEEYYIAFKKGAQALIVPLTFLNINLKEGYFKFQDSLIPLHRIIGIKHEEEGWLLLRHFDVPIVSYDVELPNFEIDISFVFDDFDIQRFFPLICNKILENPGFLNSINLIFESTAESLSIYEISSSSVLNHSLIIVKDNTKLFLRTIPEEPPPLNNFIDKLTPFHRISLYPIHKMMVEKIKILLNGLDITIERGYIDVVKSASKRENIAIFFNRDCEIIATYLLTKCRFIKNHHNVLGNKVKPLFERISPPELKWYASKREFFTIVHDYDKVFMKT